MKQYTNRALMVTIWFIAGVMLFGGIAAAEGPVHWGYEGEEGPENWGELTPDYALCETGMEQSPVNILADAPVNPADLGYNYQPSAVNIFNNGHTIQVNYDPGSDLVLEGETYELVQFHFHAGSEHTNAGEQAPMELHLVHSTAAGELAVVGAWLEVGEHNAAFEPVFNNLPATESEPEAVPGETVNADNLLPAERTYRRYNGSLTTPPCTQGVKWVMLSEPVELSAEQIAAYTDIYDNNFRPVQAFNDRNFLSAEAENESAAESEPAATESEPAADAEPAAAEEAEPATLPQSGGVAFPFASLFVGLGTLTLLAGAGLYLYSRR